MATVDTETLERAAVAAWNAFRGALAMPPGVFAHPWQELPERPYKAAWRAGVRASFAALDGATPDGLAEDGPALPPPGPGPSVLAENVLRGAEGGWIGTRLALGVGKVPQWEELTDAERDSIVAVAGPYLDALHAVARKYIGPALPPPGPNESNTWTDPDATAPGEVVGTSTEGG